MSGEDVLALLEDLVGIDSSNPSMGGGPGEGAIAAFVAEWAAASELGVEIHETTSGRPNVLVRGGRRAGGCSLLLCGHLDTVGLADMDRPLQPRRDEDRLYGRGAYDMKGGLAAALIACRDAANSGIDGEVVVAAVADEEFASIGIQELLPRLQADAAVVVEPTELEIATAHKGFIWMEIEVVGKSAHGSRPHLGIDAITKMGPILVALGELDRRLGETPHPSLGAATVHASIISGGVEESTIPDRCLLTIERRTLPGESLDDVRLEVDELLAACRQSDPELEAVSRTMLVRNPMSTDPGEEIITVLERVTADVVGTPSRVGAVSYWADSSFIAEAGIPTVLFGPTGDGAHASEEWVSIESVIACTSVLTETAIRFCA